MFRVFRVLVVLLLALSGSTHINIPNVQHVAGVNRVVTTSALGEPAAAIPARFPGNSGYDQRQMQLGLKFSF